MHCPHCEVELPAPGHRFFNLLGLDFLTCPTLEVGELHIVDHSKTIVYTDARK